MADEVPEIPAFIRAQLGPFVNVDGPRPTDHERPIERTFIPSLFRPTSEQLAAIGRVTTVWAVLEHVIEMALARLSMTANYPALALTNDLSIDNKIKAIRTLVSLHKSRYRRRVIIHHEILDALTNMPTHIARLKVRIPVKVISHSG